MSLNSVDVSGPLHRERVGVKDRALCFTCNIMAQSEIFVCFCYDSYNAVKPTTFDRYLDVIFL